MTKKYVLNDGSAICPHCNQRMDDIDEVARNIGEMDFGISLDTGGYYRDWLWNVATFFCNDCGGRNAVFYDDFFYAFIVGCRSQADIRYLAMMEGEELAHG